jgi:F420-dependent oxidoreductase-like protein
MIEGQQGLTWQRWRGIARAVEASGYVGLFRSDHFLPLSGPPQAALEMWASLTWLAANTRRIEFGPLVTPTSFRDPRITAWTAAAVDDLSGGRLRLGLGAGWQVREHTAFGFELPELEPRFARFEESIQLITGLLRSDGAVTFDGQLYQLRQAELLPRPVRRGGLPIVIGGNGPRRTLPLAARYADEWNAVTAPPARVAELNRRLDDLLRQQGRPPADVLRSYLATVAFGRDEAEVEVSLRGDRRDELLARGSFVGTSEAVVEQLQAYAEAGMQRVIFRWRQFDDPDGLRRLAEAILPRI